MLQGNGQIIKKRLNNQIFLITFPGYSHIHSERQIGKVIRQFPRRFLIFLLILLIQFFYLFFQRQIRINAHFFPGCTIRNPVSVQEAIMTLSSLLLPGCRVPPCRAIYTYCCIAFHACAQNFPFCICTYSFCSAVLSSRKELPALKTGQGAGSVPSKSQISKTSLLSGETKISKLAIFASPHACTRIPAVPASARSLAIMTSALPEESKWRCSHSFMP